MKMNYKRVKKIFNYFLEITIGKMKNRKVMAVKNLFDQKLG